MFIVCSVHFIFLTLESVFHWLFKLSTVLFFLGLQDRLAYLFSFLALDNCRTHSGSTVPELVFLTLREENSLTKRGMSEGLEFGSA